MQGSLSANAGPRYRHNTDESAPYETITIDKLTPVMEVLARANPVSYVIEGLRSLIIQGWDPDKLAAGFGVIAAMGVLLTFLCLRTIRNYDRD